MEDPVSFTIFIILAYALRVARVLLVVGVSGLLLWIAFRRLPSGWGRRGLVTFVALFWVVDLAPNAFGFSTVCRREAGVRVSAAIPGHPDIVVGDGIASAIAARILYRAGRVEYHLPPYRADRLGLAPGLHRFESIENAPTVCLIAGLRDAEMLAKCATATRIDAPTARYWFGMSAPPDAEAAAAGPWDLSWWAEKHQASVVDRTTGETLATATMLIRRSIPSLSGLITYERKDWVCPKGSEPEGLPVLLFPAAFPDLGGRGR